MVATQIFFIFNPNLGEIIQFDEHIFQMGWFNHQLEMFKDFCWLSLQEFPKMDIFFVCLGESV